MHVKYSVALTYCFIGRLYACEVFCGSLLICDWHTMDSDGISAEATIWINVVLLVLCKREEFV